ncbi:MAG TPA: hypothetical protein VIK86_05525 [Candidatus Paceibacterota bacterium]
MNTEEVNIFRSEFKRIVYEKGQLTECNLRLKQLHIWDKNDSHKNAILKELNKKDELRKNFDILLKGKDYEYWKELSSILTKICKKLNQARQMQIRYEKELINLKF